MCDMYLSVIIPAYNEEKRLKETLESVNAYLIKQTFSYEIIVVNDGSKDSTEAVIGKVLPGINFLKVINYQKNKGKGYAIHTGMLEATGEYRLFMDADNSTSIGNLEKMLPYFSEKYSVVISSRRIAGANVKVEQPKFRLLLGWIFRLVVQSILHLGIKDTQNGFKVFTANASREVFSRQTVFRWGFDVEILAIAQKIGLKIKEVPVEWVNSDQSHVSFKGMIFMLIEIIKVRWNLWTNYYKF